MLTKPLQDVNIKKLKKLIILSLIQLMSRKKLLDKELKHRV